MVQKKEFMLLFSYEPSNDYRPTEAAMNEQHQQWVHLWVKWPF